MSPDTNSVEAIDGAKDSNLGSKVNSSNFTPIETTPMSAPRNITIDLEVLLNPISILLSAIILSSSLYAGLYQISQSVRTGSTATPNAAAAAATTTTPTPAAAPAATNVSIDTIKKLFDGDYIKFGDANRKALFVEVSDPSCPYCHIAGGKDPELNKSAGSQFILVSDGGQYVAPVTEMKKLVDSGQASFLWVYYPGHGHGEVGTRALYCANDQGKFWQAQDLLMSNAGYNLLNTTIQNDKTKYAQIVDFLKTAVDPSALKNCLDSGKFDSRITSDPKIATSLNTQGTPNFFVNSKSFPGAYSWTDMVQTVTDALK